MRPLRVADQGSMKPPSWLAGGTGHGRPTAYGRRMSQAADERTGEAAQQRDAVERNFARSILAMLTVTPELSYGNGEQAFPAVAEGQAVRPQPAPLAGAFAAGGHAAAEPADPAAPVRPGSALTGELCLNVIPVTSTIASHLPRAVGLAFTLGRAARLGSAARWPVDAIVLASMGDASVNHSTAAGALNTAAYCAYQRLPLPLLVVCEDNGIGISVRTPPGWVAAATSGRTGLRYFHADGSDLADVFDTALKAAAWVRQQRSPAFLHLSMVRLGGHAG